MATRLRRRKSRQPMPSDTRKNDRREQEDGSHDEERVRVRDQREIIRIKAPRAGAKPGGPTKSLELDESYSELIVRTLLISCVCGNQDRRDVNVA